MLQIVVGSFSGAGRKASNQDFHGACVPGDARMAAKGAAIALADGISSSEFGRQASEAAVRSFLADYYCTSQAWSVRTSVERVVAAANSWLFAQTQQGQGRYDKDRGWACTFSALVIKSRTAHLFHIGDARIYQLQGRALEQLTNDHRVRVGGGHSYLGRALGIGPQVEIDHRRVPLTVGDVFVLCTDGVHAHVSEAAIATIIGRLDADLDVAARAVAEQALAGGSKDNVTVQIVRVQALPEADASELSLQAAQLAAPPLLEPGMVIDGMRVVRELHGSSRSHLHLVVDEASQSTLVLKTPSIDLGDDAGYRERFLLEEWIARRVDSPHLLKAFPLERPRSALYIALEYVDGCTLAQWMVDHPRPSLEQVRGIVDQIARGLRTLHRGETIHQDLRPENVLIDAWGTVKIIDFGASRVAGMLDTHAGGGAPGEPLPGLAQYMAPEFFLGGEGSPQSDLYSLAVITWQMLTARLPYGMEMPRCRSLAQQKRLRGPSLHHLRADIPAWVDRAIGKALEPEPHRRWGDVAEFVHALHQPDTSLAARTNLPFIERDPLLFWKSLSLLLALVSVVLGGLLLSTR